MPFTALMGYTIPVQGTESGTWGDEVNDFLTAYLDLNFAGLLTKSLSSSNVLLTASEARNQMIRCSGTLLANITISPDAGVLWNGFRTVENLTTGNFTVTVQNAAGSVVVP